MLHQRSMNILPPIALLVMQAADTLSETGQTSLNCPTGMLGAPSVVQRLEMGWASENPSHGASAGVRRATAHRPLGRVCLVHQHSPHSAEHPCAHLGVHGDLGQRKYTPLPVAHSKRQWPAQQGASALHQPGEASFGPHGLVWGLRPLAQKVPQDAWHSTGPPSCPPQASAPAAGLSAAAAPRGHVPGAAHGRVHGLPGGP